MLWLLLLVVCGHVALLVFLGTHLWAVASAYQAEGLWASLLTLALPTISHAYWMQYWPQIADATWPHDLQPLPGQSWFVYLNWFWMLAFLCVGFFATLAPTLLPSAVAGTRRLTRAVRSAMISLAAAKAWAFAQKTQKRSASRRSRSRNRRHKP